MDTDRADDREAEVTALRAERDALAARARRLAVTPGLDAPARAQAAAGRYVLGLSSAVMS
jgi:hypothetical protein